MEDDPIKQVEAWLAQQGYPLEYQVARLLRAEGTFAVEQGRHWRDTDPRTGERKARELDVVATLRGVTSVVRLVIECKHIPQPWVVFEHEDGQTASFDETVARLMASKPARRVIADWYRTSPTPWHLRPSAAFKIVDIRGDRRKKGTDETPAFEAATQLIRGAWALHQVTPKGMSALTVPVLVVEGDPTTRLDGESSQLPGSSV